MAREILYDYLKKCIEYYDELDEWLIQTSKGKRKLHKLIYKKDQAYKTKTLTELCLSNILQRQLV